jgi:iron complex outermembrane receptor protein
MPAAGQWALRLIAIGPLWFAGALAWAQSEQAAPTVPSPPAAGASAPGQPSQLQRVQITGNTAADGDTLQRQQSTASKIIVGRDEIDRFGDSNIGDVLKRLPGVTIGGPPGRGRGGPRMRGLGSGYTQLLINGEAIPAGFSLESLTPEQVERIEILRAPTAEYGARAIAGTINIVLREALRKRLNDLRLGGTFERGQVAPGFSWTRNDQLGTGPNDTYNLSMSAFSRSRIEDIDNRFSKIDLDSGAVLQRQFETGSSRDERQGLNVTSRLQWRLGQGDTLSLQPSLFVSQNENRGVRTFTQPFGTLSAPPYASADTAGDGRFGVLRVNAQWQKRLGPQTRLELRLGGGGFDADSTSRRVELDAPGAAPRRFADDTSVRERSMTSVGKLSRELASEHSLVAGWDLEAINRTEDRTTTLDGRSLLANFGNELQASSRRIALYAQDEWNPSKQWSAYAGLRWERIETQGRDIANPVRQASAVWTPLLQAVWRPDEKRRDQVRVALTRSYKSPTLRNLIARPQLSSRYPVPGANEATSPDSVGNPQLEPELATGLDLAYEHYLPAGGLFSVNLFHREISNLIRSVTTDMTVPWADRPRFVSQPRNVGDAVTQGIELEAKGRLNEFDPTLPPVSVRSNLSLFRSRVKDVPGPDNRLDEQAAVTANLGADYRFRSLPLTLGGNLNWTPAYDVQQTATQRVSVGTKRSFEAFATWVFNPGLQVRLGATDLLPLDYTSLSSVDTGRIRDSSESHSRTRTQWSLRVEVKL